MFDSLRRLLARWFAPALTPSPTPGQRKLGRPPIHWSGDRLVSLALDYKSGMTLLFLSTKYGCSVETIRKQLRSINVPVRPSGPTIGERDLIKQGRVVALHEEGKNLEEIGKAMGFSRERARQILVRAGVFERHKISSPKAEERQRIENIVKAAFEKGASLRQTAAETGVPEGLLRHAARRLGLLFRSRPRIRSDARDAEVAAYVQEHPELTTAEIADNLKVSILTVNRAMSRHAIKRPKTRPELVARFLREGRTKHGHWPKKKEE